jgi:hypothetical protein
MFSRSFKRHAAQFAISAALAAVTPAAAAGLVEGVSVAATTVDQAGAVPVLVADTGNLPAPQPDKVATHEPARLSPLAGNDKTAWDSAKSIHPVNARPSVAKLNGL